MQKRHALYIFSLGIVFALAFQFFFNHFFSKNDAPTSLLDHIDPQKSEEENQRILSVLDSSSRSVFYNLCSSCKESTTTSSPLTSQSAAEIKSRLPILDKTTPFSLSYNGQVHWFINFYLRRKAKAMEVTMGLSDLYFPIFEEMLDKYDLPLELKYLAVVESGLDPSIKSKAGALGLWQFMYTTAKAYGLEINSYVDQRSDPYASTEAACKYFKELYALYGNWELVLAAYNCGPGNVNKALKKANFSKNYWQLWPYLPKETRGYVPAFIAVNYLMNYADQIGLKSVMPASVFFEHDTVHIQKRTKIAVVAKKLNLSFDLLKQLNPAYQIDIIPQTKESQVLSLPSKHIGDFIRHEKEIYRKSKAPWYSSVPAQHKDSLLKNTL